MKIKYEFVNEVVEIEVSKEWGDVVKQMNNDDYNNEKMETRRHLSLDACNDKDSWLVDPVSDIEDSPANTTFGFRNERLEHALSKLTDTQRNAVLGVYRDGYSARAYAAKVGVHESAVSRCLDRALKKIKKRFDEM